jgi:hypothetical protein
MLAYVPDDVARASEQTGIIHDRLVYGDPKLTQLPCFPQQPGCLCQCPNGNGPVIRRHAPDFAAGHKNGSSAQLCGAKRSDQARRAGANY